MTLGGITARAPVRAGRAATAGDVGQYAPMPTLVVRDQGQSISIPFDDLLKYHGRSSIAGLAHAFKAMERAFPLMSPDLPPERYDITVESGFPGGGARDAFEMVTRAVTRPLPAEGRGEARRARGPGGHFFFRLGYRRNGGRS